MRETEIDKELNKNPGSNSIRKLEELISDFESYVFYKRHLKAELIRERFVNFKRLLCSNPAIKIVLESEDTIFGEIMDYEKKYLDFNCINIIEPKTHPWKFRMVTQYNEALKTIQNMNNKHNLPSDLGQNIDHMYFNRGEIVCCGDHECSKIHNSPELGTDVETERRDIGTPEVVNNIVAEKLTKLPASRPKQLSVNCNEGLLSKTIKNNYQVKPKQHDKVRKLMLCYNNNGFL